jgi:hypothetical protein
MNADLDFLDDADEISTVSRPTEGQVGFLRDLLDQTGMDEGEALVEVEEWFGGGWSKAGGIEFLTREEAGWLIDWLKEQRGERKRGSWGGVRW